jgi:hypothetical protein
VHPLNTAKYPFSCSSSHAPQDAIRGVKETTSKDSAMARLQESTSIDLVLSPFSDLSHSYFLSSSCGRSGDYVAHD